MSVKFPKFGKTVAPGASPPPTEKPVWPAPKPPRRFSLPFKKFFIAAGVGGAILMLAAVLLPGLVDSTKFKELFAEQSKAFTGRALHVKGAVDFRLFPTPVLTLNTIEIEPGGDAAKPIPRLRAESLSIEIPFGSVFAKNPEIKTITLTSPVLEIEQAADGAVHWDWLHPPEKAASGNPISLQVRGGKVIYFNPFTEKTVRFEDISLAYSQSEQTGMSATGQFTYLGKPVKLDAAFPAPKAGVEGMAMQLKLWQSAETMLAANMRYRLLPPTAPDAPKSYQWQGTLEGQAADIYALLPKPEAPAATTPSRLLAGGGTPTATPEATPEPMPLKFSGALSYSNSTLKIANASLETKDSSGKGEVSVTMAATPLINARMVFDRLKLESALFTRYLGAGKAEADATLSPVAAAESEPRLPKALHVDFDIGVETLFIDNQQLTGVSLAGLVENGEIAINTLTGRYAGDTTISLQGKVVEQARGMRFMGTTETSGKNLRAVLAGIDPAAQGLPAEGFSEFYVKANVFVSSEQLRLSEADFRLGELQLSGGLVTYFEATPRVEAEIALKDINLDYFRNSWREHAKADGSNAFMFKINSNVDFNWLRNLKPIVDLKLNFQHFTFLEKEGDIASFRLYAKQNEMGLRGISMRFPEGELKGDVMVNVASAIPRLDVQLEMPELNTTYFSANGVQLGKSLMNPDNAENRWSAELFDLSWMVGVASQINLSTPRLIHQGKNYDRFLLQGTLANEQLQIAKLSYERFGGKFDIAGTLTGGKVPGLSVNDTVFNADIQQLLRSVSSVDKLTGRASLSGAISTSGISFRDWIKQADAKIVLAGRGVRASGFNMQGVVDAVLASRSVAEVVNNVNKALPNGASEFSVDGNINVNGGVVRTPGITLQVGQALGNITGELLIIPWKMALNGLFQMKMLESETIPTLTVDLNGTPDDYEMRIDTASLEAYVAKRIVGK